MISATDLLIAGLTLGAIPVIVNELGEISPWLAVRVIRRTARRIPGAQRNEAEWLGIIEETPGKVTKLIRALWIAFAATTQWLFSPRRRHVLWQRAKATGRAAFLLGPVERAQPALLSAA